MNVETSVAPRPDHIAQAAVYDFNMYRDPGLLADPHERVREMLREAPPIFWTPHNGGHWVALAHEAVFEVSRNWEVFSNESIPMDQVEQMMKMLPADTPHFPMAIPITLDPPAHTKYRSVLNPYFSPKSMMARKDDVRKLADSLIDAVIDQGHSDFIKDIGEPLPVEVFLSLMGLPLERAGEFRELVHEVLAPGASDGMEMVTRLRKVADAMNETFEARRCEPRDDLVSHLWQTEIDGEPMTLELMEDFGVLLFVAGLDTVINGMGFGIRHFAQNPELQRELRENPKLIIGATEEILRRYSFTIPPRRVAKDTELCGFEMKANDKVQIYIAGADLDPKEFPEPEVFDMDRENNVHVAFGLGPHRCLGSHLARVELQIIYEQMLARLPEFRLDDDKPAQFRVGDINAIESLPIRWD